MANRDDEIYELAMAVSAAIEKARQLNLPTSAYILSMVLVEVSEAAEAAALNGENSPLQPSSPVPIARR
jgi:hypothetical protein